MNAPLSKGEKGIRNIYLGDGLIDSWDALSYRTLTKGNGNLILVGMGKTKV